MPSRSTFLATLLALLACQHVPAADWPAWRGPDRTGISRESGLLKAWPKGGPKLLWTHEEAGIGYGSPAIVGDRLFLLGGDGTTESLFALDVKSGKRLWSAELGSFYRNGWGGGPRSTPTVDGQLVYAMSGSGDLVCVKTDTGAQVWKVNMRKDLGGGIPSWGYTESPLVDGEKIICTPGGRKGTLAALDKKTGKVLWQSSGVTVGAQYASVIVVEHEGKRQYVQLTMSKLFGVDASTGARLWETGFPGRTAVIPTPIFHQGQVYVSAGYGVGSKLFKLGKGSEVSEVYSSRTMQNQHGGVILLGGHLYGFDDRGGWTCQNLTDGKAAWTSRSLGKGSIAYADGHFYGYTERDGTCVLFEASTAGWKEKGRFTIPKQSSTGRDYNSKSNVWAHPVVANGRLYLRDQELLFCYDVKDPTAP